MQSSQIVKVKTGEHEGRAGRIVSAVPYQSESDVATVDVELDADLTPRDAAIVAFATADLELLG
jgi:ribosomal protein S4E